MTTHACPAGGGGGGGQWGGLPGGGSQASQRISCNIHLRGGGGGITAGRGRVEPSPLQHNRYLSALEGGAAPSTEEVEDRQGFTPARAHLSLQEVYGELPPHSDGMHLAGGSQTTPYEKVIGGGELRNQLASTPRPQRRWGAGLLQSWMLSDKECSAESGIPRYPSSLPMWY